MTGTDIAIDRKRRAAPPLKKRIWLKMRQRLAESGFALSALAGLVESYIRLVHRTNPPAGFDSSKLQSVLFENGPAIATCWHGQHFMLPVFLPQGRPAAAMVSRSPDAELNARVVERMGFKTVRASGGRNSRQAVKKGAIRGTIALRNHLRAGRTVFMVADIPHGTPREAGMGIVSVARLSGAPIVPVAYASSRRYVFKRAWDKAVLNLPFGRGAFILGDPVFVPADADDEMMEALRQKVQDSLNDALDKAYSIVDAPA